VASLLRGPHDLRNESLGPARPATGVANAARPDAEIVVASLHGLLSPALMEATALGPLKSLVFGRRAPAE
jgi:hypothetical protein